MWDACRVARLPELFSAPVMARLQEKWERASLETAAEVNAFLAGDGG